ncbi:MAG: hypothetical protein R3C11_23215 [Planctomycetaceae bacterium]
MIERGFAYLSRQQREEGSWLPLWFGNQHASDEENPLYGTARVLAAWADLNRVDSPAAERGLNWISNSQKENGSWSGQSGLPESVEETALAVEMLICCGGDENQISKGLNWLCEAVETDRYTEPSPIGFYFAKLWYFERLYPLIFTVSALQISSAGGLRISTSNR